MKKSKLLIAMIALILFSTCHGAFDTSPMTPFGVVATGPVIAGESTALTGRIDIRWPPTDGAGVFYVYRSTVESYYSFHTGTLIGSSAQGVFRDSSDDLEAGEYYYYRVSSASPYGSNESLMSAAARGWIRESSWEPLPSTGAINTVSFKLISRGNGEVFAVIEDSLGNLTVGLFRPNPDTSATVDDNGEPILPDYQYDASGLAALPLGGAGLYDAVVNGQTLYILYSDNSNGGLLSLVSVTAEDNDTNASLLDWSSTSLGPTGFSSAPPTTVSLAADANRVWSASLESGDFYLRFFDTGGFSTAWDQVSTALLPFSNYRDVQLALSGGISLCAIVTEPAGYQLDTARYNVWTGWSVQSNALTAYALSSSDITFKYTASSAEILLENGGNPQIWKLSSGTWENLSAKTNYPGFSAADFSSNGASVYLATSDISVQARIYTPPPGTGTDSWEMFGTADGGKGEVSPSSPAELVSELSTGSFFIGWISGGSPVVWISR